MSGKFYLSKFLCNYVTSTRIYLWYLQMNAKSDLYVKAVIILLGTIQTCYCLPHLSLPAWTPPMPFVFSHEWVAWVGRAFDLGTVTDFVPAIGMVTAGLLTALVGVNERFCQRFIQSAICFQGLAILVLFVMDTAVPKMGEMLVYAGPVVSP